MSLSFVSVLQQGGDILTTRILSDFLKQIINEEEFYELSKRKALNTLERGFHLGGKITCSRE
jgi:hypothetical protein